MNIELLKLLNRNARYTAEQLSAMLGITENEVKAQVAELEKEGIIGGYKAVVDWDRVNDGEVSAIIALNVVPKADLGFEEVAERIAKYPEVESVSLMSGAYDYCVVIEGKTMKQVALFVAEKLATIENVMSTSTHFVLRKYKNNGVSFGMGDDDTADERGNIN